MSKLAAHPWKLLRPAREDPVEACYLFVCKVDSHQVVHVRVEQVVPMFRRMVVRELMVLNLAV